MSQIPGSPARAMTGAAGGDEFVFAARTGASITITASWQTERRSLMVLGGRPSQAMLMGPPCPRRFAGCQFGILLATWDAGSALALSGEQSHPPRQALQRQGNHAVLADDVADHARGLGPVPLGLGDGIDPEVPGPAAR